MYDIRIYIYIPMYTAQNISVTIFSFSFFKFFNTMHITRVIVNARKKANGGAQF